MILIEVLADFMRGKVRDEVRSDLVSSDPFYLTNYIGKSHLTCSTIQMIINFCLLIYSYNIYIYNLCEIQILMLQEDSCSIL